MGRRLLIRLSLAAIALAAIAAIVWWGFLGSARIAALPAPPPDEGQEQQLYST